MRLKLWGFPIWRRKHDASRQPTFLTGLKNRWRRAIVSNISENCSLTHIFCDGWRRVYSRRFGQRCLITCGPTRSSLRRRRRQRHGALPRLRGVLDLLQAAPGFPSGPFQHHQAAGAALWQIRDPDAGSPGANGALTNKAIPVNHPTLFPLVLGGKGTVVYELRSSQGFSTGLPIEPGNDVHVWSRLHQG